MIEHLTVADYKKMRWKNGAGYTLELARGIGENLEAFDWRISMADVKTAGKFSQFKGMQRILTVVDGHGILLNIENSFCYLKHLQSIQFSGDALVNCDLPEGEIRDFNLIYDPKKVSASYQWMVDSELTEKRSLAHLIFIFNQSIEDVEIAIDGQKFNLQHQQSLKVHNNKRSRAIVFDQKIPKKICLIELNNI